MNSHFFVDSLSSCSGVVGNELVISGRNLAAVKHIFFNKILVPFKKISSVIVIKIPAIFPGIWRITMSSNQYSISKFFVVAEPPPSVYTAILLPPPPTGLLGSSAPPTRYLNLANQSQYHVNFQIRSNQNDYPRQFNVALLNSGEQQKYPVIIQIGNPHPYQITPLAKGHATRRPVLAYGDQLIVSIQVIEKPNLNTEILFPNILAMKMPLVVFQDTGMVLDYNPGNNLINPIPIMCHTRDPRSAWKLIVNTYHDDIYRGNLPEYTIPVTPGDADFLFYLAAPNNFLRLFAEEYIGSYDNRSYGGLGPTSSLQATEGYSHRGEEFPPINLLTNLKDVRDDQL